MADQKYHEGLCDQAKKILEGGESLAAVCAEFDICRDTLYEWRDIHPEFAKALKAGLQKSQREWEQKAARAATGEAKYASAGVINFALKNRFREDYASTDITQEAINMALQAQLSELRCKLDRDNESEY